MRSPKKAKTPPQNSSVDPVTAWARDVADGTIVAGPHIRNAARRHLGDLTHGPARGLTWDVAAADRVIRFFPTILRLAGGKFEGKPFELHPSQKFKIGSLFGWKKADGKRRFRRAYIEEGKGNGKALAIDTPIATPRGFVAIGDLRPGDQVFDELGKPCGVTAVSGVMTDRPCYRLKFSDGAEIVADAEHLWLTSALRPGSNKGVPKAQWAKRKGTPSIKTTAEIARSVHMKASTSIHPQAKWNHRVRVAGALDLPNADLPIPAYTLGAWLGDGNSDCARLTVAYADWQIVDEIVAEGVSAVERKKHSETTARVLLGSGGRTQSARNVSLQASLRECALLGDKHIPEAYFWASRSQRLALLQGLMDTDGTILKGGQAEFSVCLERLAVDTARLMRTLGFKPTMTESVACLYGVEVGRRWRVKFHPHAVTPVFRLKRKIERQVAAPATLALGAGRMIVACDPVESVPVQCISVDSDSHLFLAGEHLVPTHNSPLAAGIGMYCLLSDGESRAEVYAAASKKDQAMVLFRDAVAMMQQSPKLQERLTKSGGNPVWNLADLSTGSFFRPISSEDGQSGPRPSCALCDEVHEHHDGNVIEMLERGFKSREQPFLIMITNSGSDLNSVCWEEHVNAIRAAAGSSALDGRDGQVTDYVGDPDVAATYDDTFSFVCSLDAGDKPLEDSTCWVKANPLLGVTQPVAEIERAVRQAKAMPGKLNNILRLHFCIWTQSDKAWMARETLEGVMADFDPEEEHAGAKVYGGIDLSGSQDITALAFVTRTGEIDMPTEDGGTVRKPTFDAWIEAWTPGDTIVERSARDRAPYDVWAKHGHLRAPPGKQIRLDFVAVEIARITAIFILEWLAYDRYAYARLADEFDEAGVEVKQVEHPQGGKRRGKAPEEVIEAAKQDERDPPLGLWMPASLGMFETLILEKRIRLRINPVLISAIMSAAIEEDAFGNRWFSKRKATNRIDCAVALAMAVGVATAEWDGNFGSVYTGERGLTVFG